ncbi:MAG: AbrB/MazE/SpoVT family DNA-binding domain-containing protein [bacterium]
MPIVKIGPKHQITIPKEIFDKLHLKPGDFLEAITQGGKIIMVPRQLAVKAPALSLTKKEQEILLTAKEKIEQIQKDILHSQGLTKEEAKVASKVGLIDPDQAWWWTEEWQKGEREAEKDVKEGKVKKFSNVEDLIKDLHS